MELITPDTYSQFTPEQLVVEKTTQVEIKNASSQAFYAAALSATPNQDPQQLIDTYRKIKIDLETTGYSSDYDNIQRFIQTDADKYDRKAMSDMIANPNIPQEEKQATIAQYLKDRELEVNLTEEYLQRIYAAEEATNAVDAEHKAYDASFIFDRVKYYDDTQAAINKAGAEFDPSVQAGLLGFAEVVLPFIEGISVQAAKEEVLGAESTWDRVKNIIFMGENKVEIRKALERMPYDKRAEASSKLLSAISALPGMDMKKMFMIQDLVEDPEYATWQRGLDNLIGVLDTGFIVGGAARVAMTPFAKARAAANILPNKSPLILTAEANKTLASKVAADAINAPTNELAHAAGGTKVSVINSMILPRWDIKVIQDLPSDVVDEMLKYNKIADDIAEQAATHGINYSANAKVAAMDAVNESLGAIDGMKLHLNKSMVAQNPAESLLRGDNMERYSGIAVYGSTVKNGFSTAIKALTNASQNFKDIENVILYKKNLKTGEFDIVADIEAELGKRGSYFVGYKFDHVYNPYDAAIFGVDAVTKIGATKYGGYLFDVVGRFNRTISQAAVRSADLASAIEKRLLDIVSDSLTKLGNNSKKKVFYALEEGARQNEIFDTTYLKNKLGMSDKEVAAYYSYRKVSDIVWSMANNEMAKKLKAQGMMEVVTTGTTHRIFAKELDVDYVKNNVKSVYNPVTGTVEGFSQKAFDKLIAEGGSVGRMNKPMRVGSHKTDYVLVSGKDSQYKAFNGSVLPYINGYFQRTYKEFYFVDKIPKEMFVNGARISDDALLVRDHGDTIAAYSTKSEADAAARELAETTGERYVARRGHEYDNFYEKDYHLYQTALSNTKRRGTHLEGYGEKGLANIEDPIESLYRSIRAISSKVSYDDLLESLRQGWLKTYGHMIPATDGLKSFPTDPRQLVKQAGTAQDYANAKALLEHISTLSRAPAKTDKMWQSFMMDLSETLETILPRDVSVGIKSAGQISPTGALRKLPSVFFIALRPLRQLLVQSLQLLQYSFVDPKYMLSGQFARDGIALSFARATIKYPAAYEKAVKAGSKLMGMSEDEFRILSDNYFNKSGLPYSIDSNFYIEGLVKDIHETTLISPTKRVLSGGVNVGKRIIQYSKAAGFDIGEFINLTGSWLIARKKFMDTNPELAHRWTEKAFSDQISAHAREISYAMSVPGTLKYQKGLLALPLQFVAVPHKALLSVLPTSMGGSKAFTGADKVKIAAANLIWFGGAGFGLNSFINMIQDEIGVDLPPEVDMVVRGGTIDIAMNTLLNVMSDEKNDGSKIKFSESFAPLSGGLFFHDVMSKLLHEDWRAAIMGPSYNIVGFENSRISRAMDDISAISGTPDLSTPEKLGKSFLAVASIASGVSDYMKYRYAMHTGKLISARGDNIIEATRAEALSQLFGFGNYKVDDAYEYLKASYDEEKELRDYAKRHFEAIERAYKMYGTLDRKTYEVHLLAWQSTLNSLEPHERQRVAGYMEKIASDKMKTLGDSVISRMLHDATNGGEIRNEIVSTVMRNNTLTENQKKTILQMLNDGMNEELFNAE